MNLQLLKFFTILLPPTIIGSFEFIRHDFLLDHLSMELGNVYITLLSLLLSYIFAIWMFKMIKQINKRLALEKSRHAVYEERESIAKELHEHIAQTLFFLNIQLKRGNKEESQHAVTQIDHQLRQAIFQLRMAPEEGTLFSTRLRRWLEEWSLISGINLIIQFDFYENFFTLDEEIPLFSVIQEVFTYIRKNSPTKDVTLSLEGSEDKFSLIIRITSETSADSFWDNLKESLDIIKMQTDMLNAELQINNKKQFQLICHKSKQ